MFTQLFCTHAFLTFFNVFFYTVTVCSTLDTYRFIDNYIFVFFTYKFFSVVIILNIFMTYRTFEQFFYCKIEWTFVFSFLHHFLYILLLLLVVDLHIIPRHYQYNFKFYVEHVLLLLYKNYMLWLFFMKLYLIFLPFFVPSVINGVVLIDSKKQNNIYVNIITNCVVELFMSFLLNIQIPSTLKIFSYYILLLCISIRKVLHII